MNTKQQNNYERMLSTFRLEVPEFFNAGFDIVDRWAEQDPNKLALLAVDDQGELAGKYRFSDLKILSNKFANVLVDLELEQGDRGIVMLPNVPEWYVVMVGMIKLGVIPIPTTTQCTSEDLKYRIDRAQIKLVVTDRANASKFDEIKLECPTLKHLILTDTQLEGWLSYQQGLGEASANLTGVRRTKSSDPMLLYFTSGTVGYPKMVLHTQASYGIGHLVTAKFWQDLKPDDLFWTISDMGWAKAAWSKLFGQWTIGSCLFLHNAGRKFDVPLSLKLIEKFGVTVFCGSPTVYRLFILEDLSKYSFPRLRHCISAGEPLNPEVMAKFKEGTGLQIYDGYGQTETVNQLANYRFMPLKPGSAGRPTPAFHMAVIDENGNVLPPNTEGNIAIRVKPVRPVGLFQEYLDDEAEMSSVFRGDWYYTGDKAYVDEDGYYWFVGRADDVIITSGYRIGPFEVESALITHPAVAESAVVASPDELRGEVVKAFIILKPGYQPSKGLVKEIQDHVKKVTAPFKYPRKIEFVDSLPKTISGKIKRGELKKAEWQRSGP
jgi:acyl-coenzyme A synthetase/AMP-(fatty) acid ligase